MAQSLLDKLNYGPILLDQLNYGTQTGTKLIEANAAGEEEGGD